MPPDNDERFHASAVSIGSQGLLITGASGSGKSTLALELIALGAKLIADDQVAIRRREGRLLLTSPSILSGRIEARGLGILRTEPAEAWATAVVDLDQVETERLPQRQEIVIGGVTLPCYRRVESRAFAPMLFVMLSGGIE